MITRRILTADSDPHMHAFVQQALAGFRLRLPTERNVRFTTECVSTDEEAIRSLTLDPPDIVVTEHWAPRLDSLRILEAIQKNCCDTLAIIAATRPSIPAAVKATQLGAFDFLAKPLTKQRLRAALLEATSLQMDCVAEAEYPSEERLPKPIHPLMRIPAALTQLATSAVSLSY